jgi:hypothetical protein
VTALRPGNFISVAYAKTFARAERPHFVAPFCSPAEVLQIEWYEVRSGAPVRITTDDFKGEIVEGLVPVKSYADGAREHLTRPERKFDAPEGGRVSTDYAGAATASGTYSQCVGSESARRGTCWNAVWRVPRSSRTRATSPGTSCQYSGNWT